MRRATGQAGVFPWRYPIGWLRVSALVAIASCAGAGGTAPEPLGLYRVLFVGNSLTYYNDLPGLVEALADAAGIDTLTTATLAVPDFSLEDHWNHGAAAREIAKGGWDVVVLQQGPSALEESRALLLEYAARFDAVIRNAGGEPALYMVWPSRARFGDFDRVSESYRLAAEEVHGVLMPGGEAWRAAWRRDSTLALYDSDGLHPSGLGTYLVGLVMLQRLTGRSPVGLPARVGLRSGLVFEIPVSLAQLLQEAALEATVAF